MTKAKNCHCVFRIPNKHWWVLLSPTSEWGFEKEAEFIPFTAPEACMPLLPLLELTYEASCDLIREGLQQSTGDRLMLETFPFSNILQLALKWDTEYWPSLAVQWLESGYPISAELLECLGELQDRKKFSQHLRHQAMRLIKSLKPNQLSSVQ